MSEPRRRPELISRIPADLRIPTLEIARTLGAAGHRVWIVGGAVRDLLLADGGAEAPLKDVDLVSGALPDAVEALFPKTLAVGKAFGIVVVVLGGHEIEVATFREERGYSDHRHPDQIRYTDTPEVDARRRDFTLNALYLDPLDGELCDPTGGAADLADGVLRAVGDPAHRFREDGLRILRMARFLARFELEAAPGLLEAARAEVASLDGVSPERVLDELGKMRAGPDLPRAIETLVAVGAAERVLPGWDPSRSDERLGDVRALGERPPLADLLAALLGADGAAALRERVGTLRASRETQKRAARIVELVSILDAGPVTAPTEAETQGALALLARDGAFEAAAALAVARSDGRVQPFVEAARAASRTASTDPVRLETRDVIALGIAPGPALGDALARLERAAVGGAFTDTEGARAWARMHVVGGGG